MLKNVINEVMVAPLGEMIYSIGKGVGEAQAALDAGSLAQTLALYSKNSVGIDGFPKETTQLAKLLKEIGYRPTFYAIPETEVETKITLTMAGQDASNLLNSDKQNPTTKTAVPAPASGLLPFASQSLLKSIDRISLQKPVLQPYVAPINATNANKYNVDIEAAATLRFKIVPVPTPIYVENLIDNDLVDKLLEEIEENSD